MPVRRLGMVESEGSDDLIAVPIGSEDDVSAMLSGAHPTRARHLLARDWLDRVLAQVVRASYEASYRGPDCAHHWRRGLRQLAAARERLALAEQLLGEAAREYSPELASEGERIVTRRQSR